MVGRCAVLHCKSTYYKSMHSENAIALYSVPKSSLKVWQELMPSTILTSTSRICTRHFDESDVKIGIEILNVFHPFKRWILKEGAIPKHFLIPDGNSRQPLRRICDANGSNSLTAIQSVNDKTDRKCPNEKSSTSSEKDSHNKNIVCDGNAANVEVVAKAKSFEKQPTIIDEEPPLKTAEITPSLPLLELTMMEPVVDYNHSNEAEFFAIPEKPALEAGAIAILQPASTISISQSAPPTDLLICSFTSNFRTYSLLASLTKLPDCWTWSFNKAKNVIFCTSTDALSNGSVTVKSVVFRNSQEVSYHINGKHITSNMISNTFSSIEDITKLIHSFSFFINACDLRAVLEDKLLKEISIRYVEKIDEPTNSDFIKDILIYDLCGYLLHTRKSLTKCEACYKSVRCEEMDLPASFTSDHYTAIRSRGKLIFVTIAMFQTFRVLERTIESHFEPVGQMYEEESFQDCIDKLSNCHLLPIFCDVHRNHSLPYAIREYVGVRFYFESKRLKGLLLAEASANVKRNAKMAKLV